VGILDLLGIRNRPDYLAENTGALSLASPWSESAGNLQTIVWSDILGEDVIEQLPLTRAEAMSVPAVAKARNLLVATISKFPLVALSASTAPSAAARVRETVAASVIGSGPSAGGSVDTPITDPPPPPVTGAGPLLVQPQPSWLYRTNGTVPPYTRMTWTVDDAIFYGVSLWATDRSANGDASGRKPILEAARIPREWWTIDRGQIIVFEGGQGQGRVMQDDEVILFDFPFEGLLNVARRTIRGARDLERAWVGRAKNPIPLIDLHRTDEYTEGPDETAQQMVDMWATRRASADGAVGSTPPGVELNVHGTVPTDLMIEGRNGVRTDIGSFLNVRAAMLDGTIGIDSLTYTTKDGERNAFYELDLPFWTDYIEARLSQDDVVPRGQRVRFQKYETAPAITGPEVED
jgi:hypothetical protein